MRRVTSETSISCELNLYGSGQCEVHTGVGFFDHMLELFAAHSLIDITLNAKGDTHVDAHHTVEDVGILLGRAFADALNKSGITRYASLMLPMDETLMLCAVDISGRPFICYDVPCANSRVGDFDVELCEEFWRAFAFNAGLTLHIKLMYGSNTHHILESAFKCVARVLRQAMAKDPRQHGVPSSKGVL